MKGNEENKTNSTSEEILVKRRGAERGKIYAGFDRRAYVSYYGTTFNLYIFPGPVGQKSPCYDVVPTNYGRIKAEDTLSFCSLPFRERPPPTARP